MTLKIGDKLWKFDTNRRRYGPDRSVSSPPLYREHWFEVEIVDETTRSWITNYGKVPKKGRVYGWARSYQEVEDACFINDNHYLFMNAVRESFNHHDWGMRPGMRERMEKVAEIIGYHLSQ